MPKLETFPQIDKIIRNFKEKDFLSLSTRKRFKTINQTLCQLIQEAPIQSFLFSAVLDYIDRVNKEKLLEEPLSFATFEFWLNIFSNLSDQDNYLVRAKIAGKYIPRGDYQAFFPIGLDRTFIGSHFIAGHISPDADTTIASFWGWMDAFAARVGSGLHLWSLPGGPPDSPIIAIIKDLFGHGIFDYLARTATTLTLTAMDLVSPQKLTKELGHRITGELDYDNEKAIIMVNEQEQYLSDCRVSDIELVRPIIISFKSCLRWFENNLHTKLIALLAKKDLSISDFPAFNSSVFDVKIKDCEPALEFTEKQKKELIEFLKLILGIKEGLEASFTNLNQALTKLDGHAMVDFQKEVEALPKSDIFDSKGKLIEDRPKIFHHLDKIIHQLDQAIHQVRNYVERLDVILGTKHRVLNLPPVYLNLRSDVEEMKQKMQNYDFLTVVIQEKDGSLFPVGMVKSKDLRKSSLGTVSFRDFCNQEEVRMASYLEVISVIDHHKSSLKTTSVPSAIIGDAQSCNVLIAEQAFLINDRYSLGGMSPEEIESQIKTCLNAPVTPTQTRLLQRLLKKRMVSVNNEEGYYIDPNREYKEYLTFLHAIFDDTDLLSKVSNRDVDCVAQILNRLKSLSLKQEVEVVNFDDIKKDKNFAKLAAQRMLKHPDMYSLYKKVYDYRELELEQHIKKSVEGEYSNLFIDTKEQNGCCRVGQTKMFALNFPAYLKNAHSIRKSWLTKAQQTYQETPEIDLHIHMISTIASAEEMYHNKIGPYTHQDELWFWIPETNSARGHLSTFFSHFQYIVKGFSDEKLEVEFLGANHDEFKHLFQENFNFPLKVLTGSKEGLPMAVLRFKAGAVNSRKSQITPCLPKVIA